MSPDQGCDVLIVGAGPTGLATATALAQAGINVAVIDQAKDAAHTSRAAVVHALTLEVLQEIGATDELLRRGVEAPVFRVRDRDRVLLDIDFAEIPSRYNFTLMCPQDQVEAVLLEGLRRRGGDVERGVRATSLSQAGEQVDVRVEGATSRTYRARYVVGADGGHSTVRSAVDIPFEGASYPEAFVLADLHMDWPLSRDEITLFFSQGGLVVVAPLPEGRYRVVATLDQAPEQPSSSDIQRLLDERGPLTRPGKVHDVIWSSRFSVHHRVARSFRCGRVFLAGDAAHVHSPAGGQGMNTGIQDGLALAGALTDALRRSDPAALDAYSDARRAIAEKVVRLTDRLTRAATLKSGTGKLLRNAALSLVGRVPPARQAIATNLAELNNR